VFPTLSFPVGREKVQGLGSGGFVSTGKWWGRGDRLWSFLQYGFCKDHNIGGVGGYHVL